MFINKKISLKLNDINNMGFVFKVSDDIVYAKGLLKVQMSDKVKLEVEKEQKYGKVIYKNKRIIKRFYRSSVFNFFKIKDIVSISNNTIKLSNDLISFVGNAFTNKSMNKILRDETKDVLNKMQKECKASYKAGLHRGTIEGISSGTENNVNIDLYSTLTSKDMHFVDIMDIIKEKKMSMLMPMPTISIPGIELIMKEEKYERF
jgi:hypothetical protein